MIFFISPRLSIFIKYDIARKLSKKNQMVNKFRTHISPGLFRKLIQKYLLGQLKIVAGYEVQEKQGIANSYIIYLYLCVYVLSFVHGFRSSNQKLNSKKNDRFNYVRLKMIMKKAKVIVSLQAHFQLFFLFFLSLPRWRNKFHWFQIFFRFMSPGKCLYENRHTHTYAMSK